MSDGPRDGYAPIEMFCAGTKVATLTTRNEGLERFMGRLDGLDNVRDGLEEAVMFHWSCPKCGYQVALPTEDEYEHGAQITHWPPRTW